MRGCRLIGALALVVAMMLTCARANGDGLRWQIESFDVAINVQPDGVLDITERIAADFSHEQHHGIVREIPYAYRRSGTEYKLRIDVKGITDDAGNPHQYKVSRSGGQLSIRIGSPDYYAPAHTVYQIHYTVARGLLGLPTHDELYWNATGNGWAVPIMRASCEVQLPDGTFQSADELRTASFVGPYGSTTPGSAATIARNNHIRFVSPMLTPWTGLTIVVGFPKDHVATPQASTRIWWFLADNSILLAPLAVFAFLCLAWRLFGRDRGTPGSIAVQYEPPDNLTPVEVGTIIDERVDNHDITATIIGLATRGYLKMDVPRSKVTGGLMTNNLHFIRTEKDSSDLKPFERDALDALFELGKDVSLSSLKTKFYTTMNDVRSSVYKELNDNGYFAGRLDTVRGVWVGVGIGMVVVTILAAIGLLSHDVFAPLSTIIAAVLTAPQFVIFAWLMPRKTAKGRRALEQIKGLEEYIARAELPTLELAAQQAQFEKLLPYALALNLSDAWAKKFEGLYSRPPEWFQTHGDGDMFNTLLLMNYLNNSSSAMTRSLSAMPRTQMASSGKGGFFSGSSWSSGGFGGGSSGFGGGGFSGGGGGGGGGSGW